jgi:hypothetical protein
MDTEGLRARQPPTSAKQLKAQEKKRAEEQHPGGAIKHGTWDQAFRVLLFALYLTGAILS